MNPERDAKAPLVEFTVSVFGALLRSDPRVRKLGRALLRAAGSEQKYIDIFADDPNKRTLFLGWDGEVRQRDPDLEMLADDLEDQGPVLPEWSDLYGPEDVEWEAETTSATAPDNLADQLGIAYPLESASNRQLFELKQRLVEAARAIGDISLSAVAGYFEQVVAHGDHFPAELSIVSKYGRQPQTVLDVLDDFYRRALAEVNNVIAARSNR